MDIFTKKSSMRMFYILGVEMCVLTLAQKMEQGLRLKSCRLNKLICIITGFILLSVGLVAQTPQDSMLNRFETVALSDSDQIKLLVNIARGFNNEGNHTKSEYFFKRVAKQALAAGLKDKYNFAIYTQAYALMKNKKNKESIDLFKKAIPLLEQSGDHHRQVNAACCLTVQYFILRDLKQSNQWGFYVLDHKNSLLPEMPTNIFLCYYQIGQNYQYLNMIDSSNYYLKQAVDFSQMYEADYDNMAYTALSDNYTAQGKYNEAFDVLNYLRERAQKKSDLTGLTYSYVQMGKLYLELENNEKANTYFKQAVQNAEKYGEFTDRFTPQLYEILSRKDKTIPGDLVLQLNSVLDSVLKYVPEDAGSTYSLVAGALSEMGQTYEAIMMYEKGVQNCRQYSNINYLFDNLLGEGQLLINEGKGAQAYPLLKEASEMSNIWKADFQRAKCLYALGVSEFVVGKGEQAQVHLSTAWALMEKSMQVKISSVDRISELLNEQKYATELTEKENNLLEVKNRYSKIIMIASILICLALIVVAYLQIRNSKLLSKSKKLIKNISKQMLSLSSSADFGEDSKVHASLQEIFNQLEKNKNFSQGPQLLKTTEELFEALRREHEEKTESLKAFNYAVGHDLKSPLNNIRQYTVLLSNYFSAKDDQKLIEYFQQITLNTNIAEAIIIAMLKYAEYERCVIIKENVNMSNLMGQLMNALQGQTIGRVVQYEVSRDLPQFYGDPFLLRQVFSNLLDNAIKFTALQQECKIRIWGEEDDSWVGIHIEDNGIGISEASKNKLFTLFQKSHNAEVFPGSGVGLALSQKIIERHGGSLTYYPTNGGGATFYVRMKKK